MKRKAAVSKSKDDTKAPILKKSKNKRLRNYNVDSHCYVKTTAHVYNSGADAYDCMLNQTNIGSNNNKFYIIQLLEGDVEKSYSVWLRWGRVGLPGQTKLEAHGANLESAIKSFTKKFKEKTNNEWGERNSFKKFQGKYDLIEIDYGDDNEEKSDKDSKPEKKAIESKLVKAVHDLMSLICDCKKMEEQMASLKFDIEKSPLGKLSKKQIDLGYKTLKDISALITDLENATKPNGDTSKKGRKKISDKSSIDINKELALACSEFYTRIPHYFGMRVPPVINSLDEVKEKLELLEALENVEYAMKVINDKSYDENPLDHYYHKLDRELEPLPPNHKTRKLIEQYLKITHAPTHSNFGAEILDVFECNKPSEELRFKKEFGNRMLLWHGSRLTNWMGILGNGLRIAPPEAPVNGYMFGKGIYFADVFSKSANYACASRNSDVGLLVLCEVALGEMDERRRADSHLPKGIGKGKSSVIGLGSHIPDEKTFAKLDDGTLVPCGKIVIREEEESGHFSLLYNEYIVYDISQVRLRYLVKVKFNFH